MAIVINEALCDGCNECVENCPVEMFELNQGVARAVRPLECVECETCLEVCHSGAITHVPD